jgi:hypothetical protein
VAPVDIEALSGGRFHTHIGALGAGGLAHRAKVILDDREAPVVTQRTKPLRDHRRVGRGILLEQFLDGRFEGVELAGAVPPCGRWSRGFQILG